MARPPHPGPTERELLLLQLLWKHGPAPIRDLLDAFPDTPKPAYTSLQTNLQGMLEKGYISRDERNRTHIYQARLTQGEVERDAVQDIVSRVFGGSALRLVATALAPETTSEGEIARLQALLNERKADG
ncbi:N/A [soil metagenome]